MGGVFPPILRMLRRGIFKGGGKFHRTNVIIEFIGDAMAAVWAVINIFIADSYAAAPLILMMAGQIIAHFREIILTGAMIISRKTILQALAIHTEIIAH